MSFDRTTQNRANLFNLGRPPRKRMRLGGRTGLGGRTVAITASKSSGFIGTSAKYSKKQMKTNKEVMRRGICYVREHAHSFTGSEMVVIGHSTTPEHYYATAFALAIVKMIFAKHNWLNGGTMTALLTSNNGYVVGDIFQVGVIDKEAITGGSVPFSNILTVAAGSTVDDLVSAYRNNILLTYVNAGTSYAGIRFVPAAGSFKDRLDLNLSGAKFYVHAKSTLKIQNQAVAAAGDNEDSVNNIPIFGRYYETNGTYLQPRKQINQTSGAGAQWTASRTTGSFFVSYTRDSSSVDYREPPQPSFFSGVKTSGKDKLDPGEVRTSVLTSTHIDSVNKLHKFFSTTAGTLSATAGGKFRCFAFERMIDIGASLADIRVSFENDTKIWAVLKLSNQDYWGAVVDTRLYG